MSSAPSRATLVVCAAALAVTACSKRESTGTVVGPPLTYELRDAGFPALDASPPLSSAAASPVLATFVDLQPRGAPVKVRACEYVVIAVAHGRANASGVELLAGDTAVFHGAGGFDVKGEGLALRAAIHEDPCAPANADDRMTKVVVKASRAPDLAWADGKMHAHLDVQTELGHDAYVGRLEVGAKVASTSTRARGRSSPLSSRFRSTRRRVQKTASRRSPVMRMRRTTRRATRLGSAAARPGLRRDRHAPRPASHFTRTSHRPLTQSTALGLQQSSWMVQVSLMPLQAMTLGSTHMP